MASVSRGCAGDDSAELPWAEAAPPASAMQAAMRAPTTTERRFPPSRTFIRILLWLVDRRSLRHPPFCVPTLAREGDATWGRNVITKKSRRQARSRLERLEA